MHVTHKTAKPLRDLQTARDAVAPLYNISCNFPSNYILTWVNSTKTKHVREILVTIPAGSQEFRNKFYNIAKATFAKLPAKSWAIYKYGKQYHAKVFYTS